MYLTSSGSLVSVIGSGSNHVIACYVIFLFIRFRTLVARLAPAIFRITTFDHGYSLAYCER